MFVTVPGMHSMPNTRDSLLMPFPSVLRISLFSWFLKSQCLSFLVSKEAWLFLSNQEQSVSSEGVWSSESHPRLWLDFAPGNCLIPQPELTFLTPSFRFSLVLPTLAPFYNPFIYFPWGPRTLQVNTGKHAILRTQENHPEDLIIQSQWNGDIESRVNFPSTAIHPFKHPFWGQFGHKLLLGDTLLQLLCCRILNAFWCLHDISGTFTMVLWHIHGLWMCEWLILNTMSCWAI